MPPPPFSALKPGSTLVNIILKADQPTGKLTTGIVADILTRGDHPRGVKVRLVDGRVGRVQRVLERASGGGDGGGGGLAVAADGEDSSGAVMRGVSDSAGRSDGWVGYGSTSARKNRRNVPAGISRPEGDNAVVTGSLMDFVKPVKQRRRRGGKARGSEDGERIRGEGADGYGNLKGDNGDGNNAAAGGGDDGTATVQRLLEKEFPSIDTALVAAILLDHEGDLGPARGTLKALV